MSKRKLDDVKPSSSTKTGDAKSDVPSRKKRKVDSSVAEAAAAADGLPTKFKGGDVDDPLPRKVDFATLPKTKRIVAEEALKNKDNKVVTALLYERLIHSLSIAFDRPLQSPPKRSAKGQDCIMNVIPTSIYSFREWHSKAGPVQSRSWCLSHEHPKLRHMRNTMYCIDPL